MLRYLNHYFIISTGIFFILIYNITNAMNNFKICLIGICITFNRFPINR